MFYLAVFVCEGRQSGVSLGECHVLAAPESRGGCMSEEGEQTDGNALLRCNITVSAKKKKKKEKTVQKV